MQTIFQLFPSSVKAAKNEKNIGIPCCEISDEPSFSWRGLNLDCCRHFMSKDFVKRYIDILAYYKFNVLHWHLTDDQAWRIEIKKYPKLTQVGAWRVESDGSVYSGFYSQEDVKEIVSYARIRFITIVPEIEMPGHSLASLSAYPENSCSGGPFKPANSFGVFKDIYCAGRDSTYIFIHNVLDEITQLFPGKFIHIGGDEAPKNLWKECPICQAKMKTEGLKDENELQSYFIKNISAYLTDKGKSVIGWDEILQGGLAPGTIVQSWQGFQGAVDAANLGHYTICSPESFTYFNTSPENLDLRKVYSFNPVPDTLPENKKNYVLGGEVNLWTEYIKQENVDENLFPRMLALAEVFWSNPQNKNFDEFYSRVKKSYADLRSMGIKYGREAKSFTYNITIDKIKKESVVNVVKLQDNIEIRYTVDGTIPDSNSHLYLDTLKISKPLVLKIAAFNAYYITGVALTLKFVNNMASGSKITISNQYAERYNGGGKEALIDGIKGTTNFHDGLWQGYEGVDFEGTIDLGELKEIHSVAPTFLFNQDSWIFLPEKVEISLSEDNIAFNNIRTINNDIPQKSTEVLIKEFAALYNKEKARYIKVKALSIKECPDWHSGSGGKAWLFIDEILVK
ncbi:MAG: family 20 glycosylhydrolase [Ignavibacteriaceae bacterium]|nr:family 20 glycosylhydrolase [Ignavibacteriaceae bacterium]